VGNWRCLEEVEIGMVVNHLRDTTTKFVPIAGGPLRGRDQDFFWAASLECACCSIFVNEDACGFDSPDFPLAHSGQEGQGVRSE